jgi:hypothetical protein
MGRIVDNIIRLGAGQSFTSNPKNEWLEAGPEKVMRLMEASIWDARRARWKRQHVKRWLRDYIIVRPNFTERGNPCRVPRL